MLWNNNYNFIESIDQRVSRGAPSSLPIEYLIVGGGAAGRVNNGAGGGSTYAGGNAGGFLTGSLSLSPYSVFTINVGEGGVVSGAPASQSLFNGLIYGNPVLLIASGGNDSTSGAPQSFVPGAFGTSAGPYYSGGGGASAMRNGYDGVNGGNAGNGGDAYFWFSGSYCGGGGGGIIQGPPGTLQAGIGGNTIVAANKGGGGDGGSVLAAATTGSANTGGGGGAAGNNNGAVAKNGGSGIVVVRYLTVPEQPGFPLCTGGIKYTDGLYTYHRFISGSGELRTYTL